MTMSKINNLDPVSSPLEELDKHNKFHNRVIMGSNVVLGVTSITMLAKDGVELTPANLHMDIAGPEMAIVGGFAVLMASIAKRYGPSSKTQAVLKDNEKIVQVQGSVSDKVNMVNLKEDIRVLEKLADQSWKKSRNYLLMGLGGAIIASSLSVGAAVITPAVAVVTAGSIIIGTMGMGSMIKTINYGKLRDKKLQDTSEITHNALKPKF